MRDIRPLNTEHTPTFAPEPDTPAPGPRASGSGLTYDDLGPEERAGFSAPGFSAPLEAEEVEAAEETEAAAPLEAEEARELGFSDAEMDLLLAAGVLVPESRRGPWRPETLEDVDWILARRKQLRAEIEELEHWHHQAVARLERAEQLFERFDPDCHRLTLEHLPRKKDGSFKSKSLILPHGKVKLTASAGGPRLVDKERFLAFLAECEEELPEEAFEAVKATTRTVLQGSHAFAQWREHPHVWSVEVLLTPLKEFVRSLPPVPDEHGEARPATVPGVELEPPSERWGWE